MKECSKSIHRNLGESNFLRKYFVYDGIYIGDKPNYVLKYKANRKVLEEAAFVNQNVSKFLY